MYKKSKESTDIDLFTGTSQLLTKQKLKIYESEKGWHNIFYKEVTSSIEEELFKILYSDKNGRPNSSIRILVAMQILKEGFNWSDEQLFYESKFNLLVMRALGLNNINDEIPALSTYYDFRRKLSTHKTSTGEDLMDKLFSRITNKQVLSYNVNGSKIRMDSKLISSNIAACTRLQLIIGMLQKFYKGLTDKQKSNILKKHRLKLEEIKYENVENIVYPLTKKQTNLWLINMGKIYRYLLNKFSKDDSDNYDDLSRLYKEQYRETEGVEEVNLTPTDELTGNSIQSPHDTEASYRNKGHGTRRQKVRGYVSNITETCDDQPLNLITNIITETVTTPDDYFFEPAIKKSEQVAGEVKDAWTDGAYNSPDNYKYAKSKGENFNWYLSAIQGEKGLYEFSWGKNGELIVFDLRTGKTQQAFKTENSYRIINTPGNKGTYRYFKNEIVVNYFRRIEIENQPDYVKKRRPNIESTIHHTYYNLDGRKAKYRGEAKIHNYGIIRCLWVNYRRICKYLINIDPKELLSQALYELTRLKSTIMLQYSFYNPILA